MSSIFDNYSVSKKIKDFRIEANLTQEELANSLALSVTYLSQIEGGYKIPSITLLERIGKKTGHHMFEFFMPPDFSVSMILKGMEE